MDVEIINPFIESVTNVLETMAQLHCVPGKLTIKEKDDNKAKGCVTGIIEVSGKQLKGSLAITFTSEAILLTANNMLGEIVDDPGQRPPI